MRETSAMPKLWRWPSLKTTTIEARSSGDEGTALATAAKASRSIAETAVILRRLRIIPSEPGKRQKIHLPGRMIRRKAGVCSFGPRLRPLLSFAEYSDGPPHCCHSERNGVEEPAVLAQASGKQVSRLHQMVLGRTIWLRSK